MKREILMGLKSGSEHIWASSLPLIQFDYVSQYIILAAKKQFLLAFGHLQPEDS